MTASPHLTAVPLAGLPLFAPGMSVAAEIIAAAAKRGEPIGSDDVIVVAQKIVSKAEGRLRDLRAVEPSADARRIAGETGRDPALVDLIVAESSGILRAHPAAIIARHATGHVLANAGIDASNVAGGHDGQVLLWPVDPDASARTIRDDIGALIGEWPAVIIADSMGRAWRVGTVGTAIGCAGIAALDDRRGQADLFGRVLQATVVAVADSIAALATLAMGEGAVAGLRPIEQDMFR